MEISSKPTSGQCRRPRPFPDQSALRIVLLRIEAHFGGLRGGSPKSEALSSLFRRGVTECRSNWSNSGVTTKLTHWFVPNHVLEINLAVMTDI